MRPIKRRTKNAPLNVATHLPITKGERIHFYQNSIPPCKGILRCVARLLYHISTIISSIIQTINIFWHQGVRLSTNKSASLTIPKNSLREGVYTNLGPTGYTPCELHRLHGGTMCCASFCDALAEQSARGSLVYTQTRLRLIM